MNIVRLDGILLSKILQNGLYNLKAHENEINKLNVFPVADGDTGTNMRLTLENGIKSSPSTPEVGKYLCSLSNGMLLGARGNSGVILSQLFKGIYLELSRADTVNAADLRNALIKAYRVAYASVLHPVEGTILTVAREGIENIRSQIGRNTRIDAMLAMYVAEMKKSLSRTPELLDVLKKSGVVDSGAMGYIMIVEGMLRYFYGEKFQPTDSIQPMIRESVPSHPDFSLFNENSSFEYGYCMEFILQLMNSKQYNNDFDLKEYINSLSTLGESIVAVQDNKRVKVHIHTKKPAKIIILSQQYGEFLTFKLENMQLEHNEQLKENKKPAEKKALSVVSVVDGKPLRELFSSLGCDIVIDGGATMNSSTNDFLEAFNSLNADTIIVLPNNKNTVSAALQAKSLYTGSAKIEVLNSRSIVDAYYALAMDVTDSTDTEYRISQMKAGIDGTHTLAVTSASKNYSINDFSISTGDEIAIIDGDVVFGSHYWIETVISGLKLLSDIENREMCIIFRGDGTNEAQEEELTDAIEKAFPDLEVNTIYGGQHIYHWLIGLI